MASNLQDPINSQSQGIKWLAEDVKVNAFNLINDQAQIVQGTLAILFYSFLGDTGRWCNLTGWLDHSLSECYWGMATCALLMARFLSWF